MPGTWIKIALDFRTYTVPWGTSNDNVDYSPLTYNGEVLPDLWGLFRGQSTMSDVSWAHVTHATALPPYPYGMPPDADFCTIDTCWGGAYYNHLVYDFSVAEALSDEAFQALGELPDEPWNVFEDTSYLGQTFFYTAPSSRWFYLEDAEPPPTAVDDPRTFVTYDVGAVLMNILGNDLPQSDTSLFVQEQTVSTAEYDLTVSQNGDVVITRATVLPENIAFQYTLENGSGLTDTGDVLITIPACADSLNFQTHRQSIQVVSDHLAQLDAEIAGTLQLIDSMDSVNYSTNAFRAMMGYQWTVDTFATIVATVAPVWGQAAIGVMTAVRDYVQSGFSTSAGNLALTLSEEVVGAYAKWLTNLERAKTAVTSFAFAAKQSYNLVSGDYGQALNDLSSIRDFITQQEAILASLEQDRLAVVQGLDALEAAINQLDCREVENRAALDAITTILQQTPVFNGVELPPLDTSALNPPTTSQNVAQNSAGTTIRTSNQQDTINSGGGNDIVFAQAGNDQVSLGTGNDVAIAGLGNDFVNGNTGNDDILGGDGQDTIVGGQGLDTLAGEAGNDVLIAETQDAEFDAASASVVRLYKATLDRLPDTNGHTAWTQSVLNGTALTQIASGFVNSAEFQSVYGTTSNAEFVELLYQNVLNRASDSSGAEFWQGELGSGARSREDVVIGFSESQEFQQTMIAEGLAFSRAALQTDWSDDIFRLYQATLSRTPDIGGFEGWTSALAHGQSLLDVAANFVGSVEFNNVYGALDDEAFVTLLYNNVLSRAPDSAGAANWAAQLESGRGREDVVVGFSQSPEFVANTEVAMGTWMASTGLDDVLEGGPGEDVLFGGVLSDTFLFNANEAGNNTVADFSPHDLLELMGFGFTDGNEAASAFIQNGSDAVLDYSGGQIRLIGYSAENLMSDDFILS